MTRDILLDLLAREPFHPLTLTLSNSDRIPIERPDGVRVGRNYLVVDAAEPPRRLTITLHHVLCVESESEPKLEAYEEAALRDDHPTSEA